jgi:putative sigma-54 modulation protein
MEAQIQSLHFKATAELQEFIQLKIGKLYRFTDRIISCDVFLKLDNSTTHENKVCELRLSVPGRAMFAERQCKSFEEAAVGCIDALYEQLMKWKETHQ